EVALALEHLGDLADPLDEHERAQLAKRVVERMQHAEEERARAGDAGRDVTEDEDLGAPWTPGAEPELDRDPAALQRSAHRPAHVDVGVALAALELVALRGQPALELRHDLVDLGQVLDRTRRQRTVELVERALGRQTRGALDQIALELAAQVLF